MRDRNSQLYRETLQLQDQLHHAQNSADAWRQFGVEATKINAKNQGEAFDAPADAVWKLAFVPMVAGFPFPEYFEAARLRCLEGGQVPESIVRVLYYVGQFDGGSEA